MSSTTKVQDIPECDMCRSSGEAAKVPAYADARIPAIGSWAYLCVAHFDAYGCELGTGRGQRLVAEA